MSTQSEPGCDNCGVAHGPDDIFCENCGYDFITGSLPSSDEQVPEAVVPEPALTPVAAGEGEDPTAITGSGGAIAGSGDTAMPVVADPASGAIPVKLRFSVSIDRAYFEAVVSEGELEFPDPVPAGTVIDVNGVEFHIGRTSQSRAIHPDLDIAALTGDPAVSSRHAVIRVDEDGAISVIDVGSTNGTFVGSVNSKAIAVGDVEAVVGDTPVYVGAWTRIEIEPLEVS